MEQEPVLFSQSLHDLFCVSSLAALYLLGHTWVTQQRRLFVTNCPCFATWLVYCCGVFSVAVLQWLCCALRRWLALNELVPDIPNHPSVLSPSHSLYLPWLHWKKWSQQVSSPLTSFVSSGCTWEMPLVLIAAMQMFRYPVSRGTEQLKLKFSPIFSGVISAQYFWKPGLISLFDILNSLCIDLRVQLYQ